jgi:hypothetical protein
MTITAKYPSKCAACGGAISAGEQIEWSKGSPARHTQCNASSQPSVRSIDVERAGRRSYLRGDTLSVRGLLRAGGCHWDADERAWWIGDAGAAERLAEQARTAPAEAAPKKRITHCVSCGDSLDEYQIRRGYRKCLDCGVEGGSRYAGGQSYYTSTGHFVLGDDD